MPVSDLLQRPTPFAHAPTRPELPLQGLTLLTVEDSRFACEALRLMCLRSGARLRRAEAIGVATRHLAVYRPDLVIVDLGLPDGDGAGLIRSLAARGICVLGTSGEDAGRPRALAAGATGFLAKPLAGLAAFQSAILGALGLPLVPAAAGDDDPAGCDRLAFRDDLIHAASLLDGAPGAAARRYATGFLAGIARSAGDGALEAAARAAASTADRLPDLRAAMAARLAQPSEAFSGAVRPADRAGFSPEVRGPILP